MNRSARAAAVLLLAFAAEGAAARDVKVTAPDGTADVTATVSCLDPESAAVRVDPGGRATVPDGCRRVRCESARWLPGSGTATCALRPAVVLTIELPLGAGGAFELALSGTSWTTALAEGQRKTASPPIAPGRYELTVGRPDGSWSCRADLHFPKPHVRTLFVPWRDPALVLGRVATPAGEPLAGMGVTLSTDPVSPDGGETWRCEARGENLLTADDGSFRLPVDPQIETLLVVGGWTEARGIAFVSRQGAHRELLRLIPSVPHRATARIIDEDDRPVGCKASVILDDRDERWAARAVPGGPKEATCREDGRLEVGPVVARAFSIDLRPERALPIRVPAMAGDLGDIRVDRGASLDVLVTDEAHHPVSGAAVRVESRGGFVLVREARTDPDGKATVTGLPPAVRVSVAAEAPGYVEARRSGVAPEGEITLELQRSEALRGRVTDTEGDAVRSRVRASSRDGAPVDDVETDDSGAFSFTSLPEGIVLLRAEAPGFTPSEIVRVDPGAGDRAKRDVVLVLRETGSVRGTVFDPDHRPIAGATVVLARGELSDPPEAGATASTRTGHDGGFELPSEGTPDEGVVALAAGFAAAFGRPRKDGTPLELTLPPEAHLLVRLPRATTSASLSVLDASGIPRRRAVHTLSEIQISGLAPGPCAVSLGLTRQKRVHVTAGEVTTVDLSAGARVHGLVTVGGRPCPRAAVMLAQAGPSGSGAEGGVLTDAGGRFSIEGAAPGSYLLVAVAGTGRAERRVEVPDFGELQADLDIVEATFRVTVRERDGPPVVGGSVTATPSGARCTSFASTSETVDGIGWEVAFSNGGCARAITGADGTAVLQLGRSGPHGVAVEATGFAPWSGLAQIVEGGSDLLVELMRGGPPVVRVILDTDPPLTAGTLFCVQGNSSSSRSPVAGEGACEKLAPGPADVAFRADDIGFARASIVVPESGETAINLRVLRAGRLSVPLQAAAVAVRVLDERGVAWNLPYGLGWPRCGLEDGGSYVCREIPPGTYTVEVDGKRRAPVLVRSGEAAVAH